MATPVHAQYRSNARGMCRHPTRENGSGILTGWLGPQMRIEGLGEPPTRCEAYRTAGPRHRRGGRPCVSYPRVPVDKHTSEGPSGRQKSGMSGSTRPQTECAALYGCPARAVVAPSPYRPTPTAKTAGGDSRVVLDPGGGTEVAWMM